MDIIYKEIKGFDGKYVASTKGDVFRIKKDGSLKEVSQSDDGKGYLKVTLHKDGKSVTIHTHRIIAETFKKKRNKTDEVNHINENRYDNRVENLEYVSHKYNCYYKTTKRARELGVVVTYKKYRRREKQKQIRG